MYTIAEVRRLRTHAASLAPSCSRNDSVSLVAAMTGGGRRLAAAVASADFPAKGGVMLQKLGGFRFARSAIGVSCVGALTPPRGAPRMTKGSVSFGTSANKRRNGSACFGVGVLHHLTSSKPSLPRSSGACSKRSSPLRSSRPKPAAGVCLESLGARSGRGGRGDRQ